MTFFVIFVFNFLFSYFVIKHVDFKDVLFGSAIITMVSSKIQTEHCDNRTSNRSWYVSHK